MSICSRRVLLVDPDASARAPVARRLTSLGFDVHAHAGVDAARVQLARARYDLVVADLDLLLAEGSRFLADTRACQPGVPLIALTYAGSLAECVEIIRAGAVDCLTKPLRAQELEAAVQKAARGAEETLARRHGPAPAAAASALFVAGSRRMRDLVRTVLAVARGDESVLIGGERGTGKNALATLVHEVSPRARGPLVSVSCSGLPGNLAESELFGVGRRPGALVQASGGTLVLDDVGELPDAAQARLLRVLEEGQVTPLGVTFTITVDLRVVAVARGDLEAAVAGGRFRVDLYRRLSDVSVDVPPLRERREDVVLLAQHFLEAVARRHGRRFQLARETLAVLRQHDWPGNVRELEHTISRLAAGAATPRLGLELLPARFLGAEAAAGAAAPGAASVASPDPTGAKPLN